MAVHGRHTKVWIDQFDFSGHSNGLDTSMNAPNIDVTAFQDAGKSYVVTWPEMGIAHNGYIQTVDDTGLEKAIYDRLGVDNSAYQVAALYGTEDANCPAYILPGVLATEMQIQAPVEGVLTISAQWRASQGGGRRGLRVADQAVSATGALVHVDFGAAGAAGGSAYLFVRSITGTATNATIQVQSDSSPGFGAPEIEGTFTFSVVGGKSLALTGAIGRYVRLNVTSLGGATGLSVGAIVCVNGVTM